MTHPFGGRGVGLRGNRGSRRRLRRIKLAENGSPAMWALLAFVLLVLLVVFPWLLRHPLPHQEEHVFGEQEEAGHGK
jgi:hypothetical protein